MNFAMKRRKQFQEDPVAEEVEGVDVYDIYVSYVNITCVVSVTSQPPPFRHSRSWLPLTSVRQAASTKDRQTDKQI